MLPTERTLRTYCTGGDLFGVGAAQAGFRIVDGFEIDPRKAAIARLNGHNVHVGDVLTIDQDTLAPVAHEHWSPSCKTASQANSNGGETPDDIAVADACVRSIHAHAARGGRTWSLENVWGYRGFANCFPPILAALTAAGFVWKFEHINMADFGVPQTRKRLILWAVHRSWRASAPTLHPTHRKGGDMFHAPWVGWYEAIADLIPSLPATQPAPWQLQRMGRMPAATTLVHPTDMRSMPMRNEDDPAFTVLAGSFKDSHRPGICPRAYLVSNAATEYSDGLRDSNEPAHSVTTQQDGRLRALLLDGSNGRNSGQAVSVRPGTDPAFTLRTGRANAHRARLDGRWVKVTLPCLARFQTVPDDYRGLTAEINGNAVPPLFARRLMEALYAD